MIIKALHGGKLLCLMAAVASVMTLGSCKDDDDEPAPAPVPAPVVLPDDFSFRINDEKAVELKSGDTIKANTLLVNGANSDMVNFGAVLKNNANVTSASFTLSNSYLQNVKFEGDAKDSIYSVTVPAIEGTYTLTINGKSSTFYIVGTGKSLSAISRNLSNCYTTEFDSQNTKVSDFTFSPYTEDEDGSTHPARLEGKGSFMSLTEDEYNKYVSDNKAELSDIKITDAKASIFNVSYFLYRNGDNNYLCKVLSFEGPSLREASSIKLSVTF